MPCSFLALEFQARALSDLLMNSGLERVIGLAFCFSDGSFVLVTALYRLSGSPFGWLRFRVPIANLGDLDYWEG